jgi:hypothetical protein
MVIRSTSRHTHGQIRALHHPELHVDVAALLR